MIHLQKLFLLSCICLLCSCGFTLRGTTALPDTLQPLFVESLEQDSAMERELRRALANNDVALADSAQDGLYRLGIGREQRSERAISVNVNARAGEYELSMTVPFQLRRNGEVLMGPERLTTTRVYLADPENAVAKNQEAEQIQREMRQDLSQQILRRLQALPQ